MWLVGLCSAKGGTGKTTLAFNLAERAAAAGLRVLVLDFDPQEASVGLSSLRSGAGVDPGRLWPVERMHVGSGSVELLSELRRKQAADLVVCDLPGNENNALGQVLSALDLVLSPVCGTALDLMSAVDFHMLAQRMDVPVRFVANNMNRGNKRVSFLRQELEGRQAKVCPVVVHRRVAYQDSQIQGLGVAEAGPESPAAVEMTSLWEWLLQELYLTDLLLDGFLMPHPDLPSPILRSRNERNSEQDPAPPSSLNGDGPADPGEVPYPTPFRPPEPAAAPRPRKPRRVRPDYQQPIVLTSLRLPGKTRMLLDEFSRDSNVHLSSIVDEAVLEYLDRKGFNVDRSLPLGA